MRRGWGPRFLNAAALGCIVGGVVSLFAIDRPTQFYAAFACIVLGVMLFWLWVLVTE